MERRSPAEKETEDWRLLKRRGLFLFFFLPFASIFIIFYLVSLLNRAEFTQRTESLVLEQLEATAGILGINISHLLAEDQDPQRVLDLFIPEENIYFMAILDGDKNVVAWNSRFEGYLPISLDEAEAGQSSIIDSPIGKIFSTFRAVRSDSGSMHLLYLGYSLRVMEEAVARTRRHSLFLFGLLVTAGAVLFRGISLLQAHFLAKTREAEAERLEKERFREVSAYTSGVAHEIKNPLNSLSLLLELLQKRAPAEMQEDISLGKKELLSVGRIIDQFSDAVRPIRLSLNSITVDEVMKALIESLTREFPSASTRLQIHQERALSLKGDRELLVQVFLNLVKNAYEASAESQVNIDVRKHKKGIRIEIRDTGPGMPREDFSRIFEPFFSTKDKGLGIGLYLARKIIEAHGGTLEGQSQEGEGTRFFIQIPGG